MKKSILKSGYVDEAKIGIIGFGHLGRAVLEALLAHGFMKENIRISYKGSPVTYEKIEKSGLTECISENHRIFNEAEIVFITTKPQDVKSLAGMVFPKQRLVVSCLAGVSIDILKNIFKTPVYRMMVSGPDTIAAGQGMATLYPCNEIIGAIFKKMGLRMLEVASEKEIDIFTAGVCLPAALLLANDQSGILDAINEIVKEFAAFSDLYGWAQEILPFFTTESEKAGYISRMITKGGVTEAIVDSLESGERFITDLRKGITRSQDISREIGHSILA